MTTARSAVQRRGHPQHAPTSTLVLTRTVGEGFSVGEDWSFDVLGLTARFIDLAATHRSRTSRWQLEVDDALQITADNTLARSRQSRPELARLEVRVARVATNRATLVIHGERSLKITRHESTPTHGSRS